MRQIHDLFLLKNSMLFAEARNVLVRLREAGVDFLLFKGIGIVLRYHLSLAARPMGDVDILVKPDAVRRAERVLAELGWHYAHPRERRPTDVHSYDYVKPGPRGFDLHWYALLESPRPAIDDGLWARAETTDWDGFPVNVMAPADLVLTGVVNGLRETEPMRLQWIYDVAGIALADGGVDWRVVWDEARKRDLLDSVFKGLHLVHRISGDAVPAAVLGSLLKRDPGFRGRFLRSVVAGARTQELSEAERSEVQTALRPSAGRRPRAGQAAADMDGLPSQIRFVANRHDQIESLFLQRRHLPLLAELFQAGDRTMLEAAIALFPDAPQGFLAVPPGLLALRIRPALAEYRARSAGRHLPRELVLCCGTAREVMVEVRNDSACCWPVCHGSSALFGLTYRLIPESGARTWSGGPRTYLARPKRASVAFVEPGQSMRCRLKVTAPSEPGRYIAHLELVQEHVAWFSAHGNEFPTIALRAVASRPRGAYAPAKSVVHDTLAAETRIVETASGTCYSTDGYGTVIWRAIAEGHRADRIASAFASMAILDKEVVDRFVAHLVTEGLIERSSRADGVRGRAFTVERVDAFAAPMLRKEELPQAAVPGSFGGHSEAARHVAALERRAIEGEAFAWSLAVELDATRRSYESERTTWIAGSREAARHAAALEQRAREAETFAQSLVAEPCYHAPVLRN
jgi:hypothetical protein